MSAPKKAAAAAPAGWRARLGRLPWRKIALATVAFLLVVAVVPPFRRAAALAGSKIILFAAAPLAPGLGDLDRLPEVSTVVAADGSVLAELQGAERRERIELEQVPDHVIHAVLAAEDEDFYSHSGVDPEAVFRAFVRTAQGRTQGGSTITQQVAKINYTSSERTFLRKLKEVLYATKLESDLGKDAILERYLNQVYFGEGAYGIAAAADVFFATTVDRLTPAQAATLAGKIRSPEGLDPRRQPDAMVERRNQVLANMAQEKWLDEDELKAAEGEPLELAPERPSEAAKAPHFVEYVKREAKAIDALGGTPEARIEALLTGGYTVETTLDPKAFDAATAAVGEQLGEEGDPSAAVVSVAPGDGAIRVLFGGLDFSRQFDVASQGRRQPGSSFKPFVYLAALRQGIDPRSTWDAASPQTFEHGGERFQVSNYDGEGSGRMNADDALVRSVNTVYVAMGLDAGPDKVMATALDVQAPADPEAISPVPSIALGGLRKGVTPLEMASAYATFAAKGVYAEPYAITRITDPNGRVVYEHRPEVRPVFEPAEVGVLNVPMQRVVEQGTGRAARIGRPVAGKTGTTQDYGDAWFVGYVPQLATAVWVGHPDEVKPMRNVHGVATVTGGSFPARLFAATMKGALEGVPVQKLFTASPDDLDLERLKPSTTIPPDTSSTTTAPTSSTTSSSTTSTTELDAEASTTTTAKKSTTTTAKPTTTTTAKPKQTTTTSEQTTTTTTASDGGGTSSGSSSDSDSTTTTSP